MRPTLPRPAPLAAPAMICAGAALSQPVDQGPRNTDLAPAFPQQTRVTGEERLLSGIGRVRGIAVGPDGALILLLDLDGGASVQRVTRGGG